MYNHAKFHNLPAIDSYAQMRAAWDAAAPTRWRSGFDERHRKLRKGDGAHGVILRRNDDGASYTLMFDGYTLVTHHVNDCVEYHEQGSTLARRDLIHRASGRIGPVDATIHKTQALRVGSDVVLVRDVRDRPLDLRWSADALLASGVVEPLIALRRVVDRTKSNRLSRAADYPAFRAWLTVAVATTLGAPTGRQRVVGETYTVRRLADASAPEGSFPRRLHQALGGRRYSPDHVAGVLANERRRIYENHDVWRQKAYGPILTLRDYWAILKDRANVTFIDCPKKGPTP